MAHVADVTRSIEFYRLLGFEVRNTFGRDGQTLWAWIDNGKAHLMLTRADGPAKSGEQAVLFYLYAADVAAYRSELAARGVNVGPLMYPFYASEGEFQIDDPDGYCLLIGQSDDESL
jgi:hypothetical protein